MPPSPPARKLFTLLSDAGLNWVKPSEHNAVWPDGEELYDLKKDPSENKNLATSPEHAEILSAMRAHQSKAESRALAAKVQN